MQRFEEAFTSQYWIVRIYRVKPRENRDSLRVRSKTLRKFPNDLQQFKMENSIYNNYKYFNKVVPF